jgi:outer membrane protein TolC
MLSRLLPTFRTFALGLAVAGWSGIGFASPGPLPEEVFPQLQPYLEAALAGSPASLAARLRSVEASANAAVASSRLYPTVSASAQLNAQREDRQDLPGVSNSTKFYYSVSASQPLYHWGSLRNAAEIGRIRALLAERQTEEAFRGLAREVRGLYLSLVVSGMEARIAETGAARADRDLATFRVRLAEGQAAASELIGYELAASEARLGRERAMAELRWQVGQFERLTGQSIALEALPPSFPRIAPVGLPSAVEPLPSFPMIQAEMEVQAEQLSGRIHQARLRPKLNLVAGAFQDEISYRANIADRVGTQIVYAGLQVNWSIFDGLETRALRRASAARLRQHELAYRQAMEELGPRGERLVESLAFAAEALRLDDLRVDLALGGVQEVREQIDRGIGSEADLERARHELARAEVNAARRRIDYFQAVLELVAATGADPAVASQTLPRR